MIDVQRAKELLDDPELSDLDVLEIRNAFYSLADIIFDSWTEKN